MFTIIFRRGTSGEWSTKDTLLKDGEPGYERDTGKVKIGNGVNTWNDLPYFYVGGESGNVVALVAQAIMEHRNSASPHPVYDDGPSLELLYSNAKV